MGLFEVKKVLNNPFAYQGQVKSSELKIAGLIQRRRLQILIHSRLYYVLNTNIIDDSTFDCWGKELVELQNKHPEIASKICYAKEFKGWLGHSGAYLPLEDSWVVNKTAYLLNLRLNIP